MYFNLFLKHKKNLIHYLIISISFKNIMKKPLYYYNQSAVIPFRRTENKTEVLLITSRKKKKWIIPKGIVEPDLLPSESAVKEAFEEAGVRGKISDNSIGNYNQKKWGGLCNVKVYLMEVNVLLETWPEDFRDRKWVSLDDAPDQIDNQGLKKILTKLKSKHD